MIKCQRRVLCCLVFASFFCSWTSAAPSTSYHLMTNGLRPADDPNSSFFLDPINYITSKALSAIAQIATIFYQLIPYEEFAKPSKPPSRYTGPYIININDEDFAYNDFEQC